MSAGLTESQNVAVGAATSVVMGLVVQPTKYWKNAAQQRLPFTLDPRLVYRGLGVSLISTTGETCLAFGFTGFLKKQFGTGFYGEMSSALVGGSLVAPFVSATDCVCIQQQRFGGTMAETLPRIVSEYGLFRGLFRGLTPCICRDSLYVGGMLGTTPLLQQWLMKERGWGLHAAESVASIASGVLVGFLTCPFDAVSTSMKGDLDRTIYGGFFNTLRTRVAAGPATLFGGAVWRSVFISLSMGLANSVSSRIEPHVIEYNRACKSSKSSNEFAWQGSGVILG